MRAGIPRGQQYQLCRSIHSEANAIISAARRDMIGADLYLVGKEKDLGEYVDKPAPCVMCKKMIINAGINKVFVRLNKEEYDQFSVDDWLRNTTQEDYMGY